MAGTEQNDGRKNFQPFRSQQIPRRSLSDLIEQGWADADIAIAQREQVSLPEFTDRATGYELLDGLMTLENELFGMRLADKILDEGYDNVYELGQSCSGKSDTLKQLKKRLKQIAPRKNIRLRIKTVEMDEAIADVKKIPGVPQDTSEWASHPLNPWKRVSDIMHTESLESPKPTNGVRELTITELTGVGNKADEDKGHSTLYRASEYMQDENIPPELKRKILVLGMASEKTIREEGTVLREILSKVAPEDFNRICHLFRIQFTGFIPKDAPPEQKVRDINNMYMRKGKKHRVEAYEQELQQHREEHFHEFDESIVERIPDAALRRSTDPADFLRVIQQMQYFITNVYQFPSEHSFVLINPKRLGFRQIGVEYPKV